MSTQFHWKPITQLNNKKYIYAELVVHTARLIRQKGKANQERFIFESAAATFSCREHTSS